MKHTPGPWSANFGNREQGSSGSLICNKNGDILAEIWPTDPQGCEQSANARLVSAAPDLLAALELLMEKAYSLADTSMDHKRLFGEAIFLAHAALAKAKG